jgi:hypothetical protein
LSSQKLANKEFKSRLRKKATGRSILDASARFFDARAQCGSANFIYRLEINALEILLRKQSVRVFN